MGKSKIGSDLEAKELEFDSKRSVEAKIAKGDGLTTERGTHLLGSRPHGRKVGSVADFENPFAVGFFPQPLDPFRRVLSPLLMYLRLEAYLNPCFPSYSVSSSSSGVFNNILLAAQF